MLNREEIIQTTRRAILLVVFSAFLGVTINAVRPDGVSLFGWRPDPAPSASAVGGEDGVPSIALEEAMDRHRRRQALFVDARSAAAFQKGHIRGAVNLPDEAFDETIESFFNEVEPDRLIITYCEGAGCPLARQVAEKLTEMGYTMVYHLVDGWGQWKERGLPAEP